MQTLQELGNQNNYLEREQQPKRRAKALQIDFLLRQIKASQSKSKQIKTDANSRPSCSIKWQRLNATSTQCILNWIEPLQLGSLFKQDNLRNKTSPTILVLRENHEIYCHGTINYKITIATFSLLLLFASLFALILMQLQCKTSLVFSCDPCLAQRVAVQLCLLRFSIFLSTDIPTGYEILIPFIECSGNDYLLQKNTVHL